MVQTRRSLGLDEVPTEVPTAHSLPVEGSVPRDS
jgi:hypothetical protein